jgi:hypothetical protein
MENTQLFEIFTEKLNLGKYSYFITGSIASIYFGLPRLTHDVDIVLDLPGDEINHLIQLFDVEEFYIPPRETIIAELNRTVRGHFNLIHFKTGFKADIYLLGNDPLHRWALDNRKEIKIGSHIFYIAPPEYVIIRKLEYYQEGGSDKHLEDISNMLDISRDIIDHPFLEEEIKKRGLQSAWAELMGKHKA